MGKISKISVIIPVYNREMYIRRCISSVCRQTYRNLEIIIVDDGSTDDTSDICRKLADIDSRIRYIRKENEGSGYARNAGMDVSTGEFLFFVDSDDFIRRDAVEILVKLAHENRADIVKCAYDRGVSDGFTVHTNKRKLAVTDNVGAFRSREMNIAVWGKLYRREVLDGIRYPRETLYDDEFFTYRCIYNARKIVMVNDNLYYNFLSPESIMRRDRKQMPISVIKRAYRERVAYFESLGEKELADISRKEYAIRLMLFYCHAEDYQGGEVLKKALFESYKKAYEQSKKCAAGWKEKVSMGWFYRMPMIASIVIRRVV